jgi:hypothetical protein
MGMPAMPNLKDEWHVSGLTMGNLLIFQTRYGMNATPRIHMKRFFIKDKKSVFEIRVGINR